MNLPDTPAGDAAAHYLNPVYGHDFPDPFILKYLGHYWAYATGFGADGHVFPILHSSDLVHWQALGGAMPPLPGDHPCYWAPEVIYDNGRFYLYYSVGNEAAMHIRVAVAEHPAGPFVDSGQQLTNEPFAIDAHVFQDDDGRRFLFYATDFLDHSRIGTGTVCDELVDAYTLAGNPRPVTRACYEWQMYHPHRPEKGGVRWYTVEGSFVLKHKGRYYQMFSGGNWQNPSYGVGYATSDRLERLDEWRQVCDGEQLLPILCTIPGLVIGPGHNSVVRGRDNRQLFCVYHRWDPAGKGRLLAIDPLDWAGERLLVLGPSHTPQPVPTLPTAAAFTPDTPWHCTEGTWQVSAADRAVLLPEERRAEVVYALGAAAFLAEVSIRTLSADGEYGLTLYNNEDTALRLRLAPLHNEAVVTWHSAMGEQKQVLPLPARFDPTVYHLLRLDVNGRRVMLQLDERAWQWQGWLASEPTRLGFYTAEVAAALAGFSLTQGWEEQFMETDDELWNGSWQVQGTNAWRLYQQQLWYQTTESASRISKGPLLTDYELVINARLDQASWPGTGYGFYPALTGTGEGPLLTVVQGQGGWLLHWHEAGVLHRFPLPAHFDPTVYQQFRLRKQNATLTVHWETQPIATRTVTPAPTRIGLYAHKGPVAFDLVRVTDL